MFTIRPLYFPFSTSLFNMAYPQSCPLTSARSVPNLYLFFPEKNCVISVHKSHSFSFSRHALLGVSTNTCSLVTD